MQPETASVPDKSANGTEHEWYVTHGLRNEPFTGNAAGPINPIPAAVEAELEGGSRNGRPVKGAVNKTLSVMKSVRRSKKGRAAADNHRFRVCSDTNRRCTNCPCTKCRGKSLCQHDRQRHKCKDCNGKGWSLGLSSTSEH